MESPFLSIVVIGYNMARELPRTIRTLSPPMQQAIHEDEYEIILIDNGSTEPFDVTSCRRWAPHLRYHRMHQPSPSPVRAVNHGIDTARGELIGVLIDGARMSSPGLLRAAIDAARLHEWPVVGTIAFHLGPALQATSIRHGYDQRVEDALLARSGWEQDGYRLFGVSSLAGSSASGWFEVPAESNALFLRREHWKRLGGYDPAFVSPGGGLANLDMWARACADPLAMVIMLLGEATFHQVHGGVSTNSAESTWTVFHDEYLRIRGRSYARPAVSPVYYGRPHPQAAPTIRDSLAALIDSRELLSLTPP